MCYLENKFVNHTTIKYDVLLLTLRDLNGIYICCLENCAVVRAIIRAVMRSF